MNNKKPRRVNYRVNYCSSEDHQYPVSQLVLQSAESKGWQTKRFATFPQTLIVELLELTLVTNLSFLSHQNKICTKIEIQGKEDHQQNWARLGYTTLQSGTNTNYQSRELRNISIGGKLILLLKFTFHQNYANPINIFNQIGIIALLAYGQKATVEREMIRSKEGEVIANLYDIDKETIMKLRHLQQSKKEATENNDFQEAKVLKNQIESLQSNVKALIILEKQKKEAIRRQDYDTAKQIVERMQRLRGPMFNLPRNNQSPEQNNSHNFKYNDFTPKKKMKNSSHSSMNNYDYPQNNNYPDKNYQVPSRSSDRQANDSFDLNNFKKNKSNVIPFDEIVINPKDRYPVDEELNNGEYNTAPRNLPPKYKSAKRNVSNERQDPQNDNSLPNISSTKKLQKLTPIEFDQCSKFFSVFNQITFEHIYSKEHLHRQKGLKIIHETLEKFYAEDKKNNNEFVTASLFIIQKLLNDKIIAVLIANVDFFGMMMKKLKPNSSSSTSKFIEVILTQLADYLGHSNEKFREICEDVFSSLPAHTLTNKDLCFEILCKNTKDKRPRVIVGRLITLGRIVSKFAAEGAIQSLIDFGKRYLQDKNSDVRVSATAFIVQLSKQIGYENLYPQIENMKPYVIKMIEEKIQSEVGVIQKKQTKNNRVIKPELVIKQQTKLPTNPEYYCDFCKEFDKRFQDDNFRDKHLYSDCKMISLCSQCKQAIQVSNLSHHLLNQCEQHKYYKKCAKCKEAISIKQYNQHTKMKECISAKPLSVANRCPLCHEDIQQGQAGWVKHLVKERCPQNPKR